MDRYYFLVNFQGLEVQTTNIEIEHLYPGLAGFG